MHAVDQITYGNLLAIIVGLIIFIVVTTILFRKKRK